MEQNQPKKKEPKVARKKANPAEMAMRLNEVIELFLKGWSRNAIASEKSRAWGVAENTVRTTIDQAYKELKQIYAIQRQDIAEVLQAHYWQLLRDSKEKNDLYLVRLVLADIAKVYGIEPNSNNNSNVTVTFKKDEPTNNGNNEPK